MAKEKKKHKNEFLEEDIHHLFYPRKDYQKSYLMRLRRHPYCKGFILKDSLHQKIHQEVFIIPTPKDYNITDALKQLEFLEFHGAINPNDSLEKKLTVLAGLFDCCDQPTADALRKQLEVVRLYSEEPP